MHTALIVLISVLVGGIAIGFYMDWFDLWVSKEDMKRQVAAAKERMHLFKNHELDPRPDNQDTSPTARESIRNSSQLDYEPVHGWTKRQRDDYLERNPAYVATYNAELQKHLHA